MSKPTATPEHAVHVAAEHVVFCPDNVYQGGGPYTLRGYARHLIGAGAWAFWWD